jgi:hypothetical protein
MTHPEQLGFGFDEILREQETAHLPGTMEEGIPYFRKLIERHNEAMLAGDAETAMAIREEATELAYKLNGNSTAIKGGPDASCYVLERATPAPAGAVPLWGQTGEFTIDVDGMKIRIEQDGMFGLGTSVAFWPGFSAHAVDDDKPFLSETGYRSFLGIHADTVPGITPDMFARDVILSHIRGKPKGKIAKIERSYVEREMARRADKDNQQKESQHV